MKKAINAWCIEANADFEKTFHDVKAAGFDAVELNIDEKTGAHNFTLTTDDSLLNKVKDLSREYSLEVSCISSSLYAGYLGCDDEKSVDYALSIMKKQIEIARALETKSIMLVPGSVPKTSYLTGYRNAAKTISEIIPDLEKYNISASVENVWNSFFTSAFDMCVFLDLVDSEFVGATFDIGNCCAFSYPEHWIEVLGKRIFEVHVKDFKRNSSLLNRGGVFCNLGDGDVDFNFASDKLKDIGFSGYLTAEVFKLDENQTYGEFYKSVSDFIGKMI